MTAFADSSALVKLYVPEAGYRTVRGLPRPLIISQLARVEVAAAFWRKHRLAEIDAADAAVLTQEFEADVGDDANGPFVVVATTPAVLDEAVRSVVLHPLRAYDALQLATATVAQRALAAPLRFVAFNRTLRAAAAAEGLAVSPVGDR